MSDNAKQSDCRILYPRADQGPQPWGVSLHGPDGIGIENGGLVIVKTAEAWHALAARLADESRAREGREELLRENEALRANRDWWMETARQAQAHRDGANEQLALLEAEVEALRKDAEYYKWRLTEIMPLFQEARDALTAIPLVNARMRGLDLTLADRMDVAGTRTRADFTANRIDAFLGTADQPSVAQPWDRECVKCGCKWIESGWGAACPRCEGNADNGEVAK